MTTFVRLLQPFQANFFTQVSAGLMAREAKKTKPKIQVYYELIDLIPVAELVFECLKVYVDTGILAGFSIFSASLLMLLDESTIGISQNPRHFLGWRPYFSQSTPNSVIAWVLLFGAFGAFLGLILGACRALVLSGCEIFVTVDTFYNFVYKPPMESHKISSSELIDRAFGLSISSRQSISNKFLKFLGLGHGSDPDVGSELSLEDAFASLTCNLNPPVPNAYAKNRLLRYLILYQSCCPKWPVFPKRSLYKNKSPTPRLDPQYYIEHGAIIGRKLRRFIRFYLGFWEREIRILLRTGRCYPMRKYELENLTTIQGVEGECSICLDPFDKQESLRDLPCGHIFHMRCLDYWLTTKSATCPLCRRHLRSSLLMRAPSILSDMFCQLTQVEVII